MSDEPLLRVEGIVKAFGAHRVVDGVHASLFSGEIVGLVGPNGSGKSTLVNLLSGFLGVDGGRVWLGGKDITRNSANAISRQGLVRTFQLPSMPARMTVAELMQVAAREQTGRLSILRGHPGADPHAEQLLTELGLARVRDLSAAALSGGQRKLLCIAMALRTRPRLLCLDEPTAGVHVAVRAQIIDLLRQFHAQGGSVLVIEHDMHFVRQLCTRALVLDRGALIADCPPAQLVDDPRVVEAYLGQTAARRLQEVVSND
jgi:branched-chain amino acid transport system ATP-binding protein